MYNTYLQDKELLSRCPKSTGFILHRVDAYLKPLLEELDGQVDKRLVRTFCQVFIVVVAFRNRSLGLLLTQLGKFMCGFKQACAGVKRISNLLRSKKWDHKLIEDFWLQRCEKRLEQLQQQGKRVLLLWDDSVVEKSESWFSEGLCSVASSKGKRLTKVKRGFYKPPATRICVPGFEWSNAVLTALGEVPCLALMRWCLPVR